MLPSVILTERMVCYILGVLKFNTFGGGIMRIYVSYSTDVRIFSLNGDRLQIVNMPIKDAISLIRKGNTISDEVYLQPGDRLVIILDTKRCLVISAQLSTPFPPTAAAALDVPTDISFNSLPVYRGVAIFY
jgi:hypothetical protein